MIKHISTNTTFYSATVNCSNFLIPLVTYCTKFDSAKFGKGPKFDPCGSFLGFLDSELTYNVLMETLNPSQLVPGWRLSEFNRFQTGPPPVNRECNVM